MSEDNLTPCPVCGASIYPEHVQAGKAGYFEGRLLCFHCIRDKNAAKPSGGSSVGGSSLNDLTAGFDKIQLDELDMTSINNPAPQSSTQIHSATRQTFGEGAAYSDSHLKRKLNADGRFATRCRTFHSKLNDAAITFMNNQINEWADSNPDIAIKFATSTTAVFEGKHSEQNLVVTVFY
jgi:hypothetical protein